MTLATHATGPVEIHLLGERDLAALITLTAGSHLPTFAEPSRLRALLREGTAVGALVDGELLGCACVRYDVAKDYVTVDGRRARLPLPNAYLCGAYVRPDRRGDGVGRRLYARRIELARRRTSGPLVVELLGDGTPGSVHPDTLPGWRLYERAGFGVLGHSVDADGGAVIAWFEPISRRHQ